MNPENQDINQNLAQNLNPNLNPVPTPEYFTTPMPQSVPQYNSPQYNPQPTQAEVPVQYAQPNMANDNVYANIDQAQVYQPKPKSKRLLIIVLVAGLLILTTAGLLGLNYYNNLNQKAPAPAETSSLTTSVASSSLEISSSANQKPLSTGGPETPASKAKINMNAQLLPTWITEKFATISGAVENGRCILETTCGEATDYDRDNLSNLYEANYGTDPLNMDTDGDGITDGDELAIYYTDPTKADSDLDTFKDGDELGNCYDPVLVEKAKMSQIRRQAIETNIDFKGISADSIKYFISKNYTVSEQKLGYMQSKCGTPTTSATSSAVTSGTVNSETNSSKPVVMP